MPKPVSLAEEPLWAAKIREVRVPWMNSKAEPFAR
jgi:hypothetical protein